MRAWWISIGLAVAALTACSEQPSTLDSVRERGRLVVATTTAPTAYYRNRHGMPAGPEYLLTRAFGESLGVAVAYRLRDTPAAALEAVAAGEADIAAAGLAVTAARERDLLFAPAYAESAARLVCRADGPRPASAAAPDELEILIGAGVDRAAVATAMATDSPPEDMAPALPQVASGEADCAVVDARHLAAYQRRRSNLEAVSTLADSTRPVAWALPAGAEALEAAVADWLDSDAGQATLARVDQRYFEPLPAYSRR